EYVHTRHNVGFDIVNKFAKKQGFKFFRKGKAMVSENNVNGEKVILLKPQVIQENPHYYLDLSLGAAAGLYKSGDHEAAAHILNDVLQLDGMDEVECTDPTEYCHTLTLMEVLMVLCLMKMEIPSLAFDYIEAAVQNIDTYLSEEQLYITLSNALMDLAHTIVS
ncbi:MAG: aminoacyl-tRNA hydrolase, partial [Bacteroidales bacterium]|nr:aminoacyl-tRNA hydrolase [Bacteroidales bacterium]